ncbi:PQQ-dependent sugar dehydrogenase [Fluviicola taffensis]|uniref:Quinoprotein glucose dehydrogenase n=1 Tax=Fluviicola taffensis (strain DSM 16823 / NCIMB 13979 / RW262) TaxID=755732 RepID=F2I9T3_FLUTR|nr:PQQ-dependent sugar dehydrogenase [Fluviicola taffensis]AEA43079.1 Quinoprotein glucose dehydrogenase [Fluviicola taffensis DSM 16823]
MKTFTLFLLTLNSFFGVAQIFTRSELPTTLSAPWEITFGPDSMLWVTESNGRVSRIDPQTGNKTIVHSAADYFDGSPLENSPFCPSLGIGRGTLGLTLHPNFLTFGSSFIYFMYSYNSGTTANPDTRYKIRRLEWDLTTEQIIGFQDIITGISNGYDHWGGRILAVKRTNIPYLFVTIGDHGASETNSPQCYNPQTDNPNNFAQDPNTDNGKIHRFNMDGSIPADNPISGNSFYTRGHRNPQGLVYNKDLDLLYDIEHGDRTDDEINLLEKGMNYGWKDVRGYHADNNFPGESNYVTNYVPNPLISNDHLVEPIYSICAVQIPNSNNGNSWCTVAPSDGAHYTSTAIPTWTNSILLVTLKDGDFTDMEVYQFKLNTQGTIAPSTSQNPNPKKYFAEDQQLNGRLRDIAVSPDGKKIYLINNGGGTLNTDKITVYTVVDTTNNQPLAFKIYPNPSNGTIHIQLPEIKPSSIQIFDARGAKIKEIETFSELVTLDISELKAGLYWLSYQSETLKRVQKFVKE